MTSTPPETSMTPPGYSSLTPPPTSINPVEASSEDHQGQVVLLAISGPSCSGKTTLARLLRDALAPNAVIIHEDDFYKTDAQIPMKLTSDGRHIQDWDCYESLDYPQFEETLRFARIDGRIKSGFESIEDKNAVGKVSVDSSKLTFWKKKFEQILQSTDRFVIIDGFLLFSERMRPLQQLFDLSLLLRADLATVRSRREARKGYVTLEGFWEDPSGYVDQIVWPNYKADHSFLFLDGNVEGTPNEELCKRLGIQASTPEASSDMTACFDWAASLIWTKLWDHSETQGC